MGRFAYFSTDLIYKFVFGVQNSIDIEQFFGKDATDKETCESVDCEEEDCDGEHGEIPGRVWDNTDKEKILARLVLMKEKDKTLPSINLSDYEKNREGTEELLKWFDTNYIIQSYSKILNENDKRKEEDNKNGIDTHSFSYIVKHITEPSQLKKDTENMCLYCLGWIIYHQLTYVDQLSVIYEY